MTLDTIDEQILEILRNSRVPVSTREISLRIKRAWHSVNSHCLHLQLEGKIHGFRIGKMNVWEIRGRRYEI